jgi:hypothetical protein
MKTFKQSTLLLTGLLLIVVTSCKKTDVAPSAQKSVSTAVSQNASAAQPFNIQDNFDLTGLLLYDECTGELVDLSGIAHIDIHGVYNNNKATFNSHYSLQDAKGVGETSGNNYVITDNFKIGTSYSFSNDVLTFTVTETFKINATGSANNFYATYMDTETYDFSTDTYTVKRYQSDAGCR